MLPGFNHNIKYQDRVYHVQTEDTGPRLAHVTTLLFIGGNVIASSRTGYAEWRHDPELNSRIVEIMQTQHKTMLRALVSGRYDKEIAERSHNAATLNGPAPINVEAGAQHRASDLMAPIGTGLDATRPGGARRPATSTEAAGRTAGRSRGDKAGAGKQEEPRIESLAPMLTTPSAPPSQRGAPPRAESQSTRQAPEPAVSTAPVIESEQLRSAFERGDKAADDSIFGNLISPKSLDEVILSYLANNKSSDK